MYRELFWSPVVGVGVESLRLVEGAAGVDVESVVVHSSGDESFRIRYELQCDCRYRVRRVDAWILGVESVSVSLRADGHGNWTDGRGDELSNLSGCTDVDISATPFTNTLPIRRLGLDRGESAEVRTVYLSVPELRVETAVQRYTCLDPLDAAGGRYRYESLSSEFTAELPVDADGIVVDYPDLFERVTPAG
jgi:hypothetical protein